MNGRFVSCLYEVNGHEMISYRDHLKPEIRVKAHNQGRTDGKHG